MARGARRPAVRDPARPTCVGGASKATSARCSSSRHRSPSATGAHSASIAKRRCAVSSAVQWVCWRRTTSCHCGRVARTSLRTGKPCAFLVTRPSQPGRQANVDGEATSSPLKLRTTSGDAGRGRRAEMLATQFFRNRGHDVHDCSHMNHQYDLVVSGYGRVQVKCVSPRLHNAKRGKSMDLQCFMGCSTKGHYANDAFDWLCMVWLTSKSGWVVLQDQSQCTSTTDSRRMKACVRVGMKRFKNLMQPIEAQAVTLFE